MYTVAGPKLAAAVHAAGGLGCIALGYEPDKLASSLLTYRDLISHSSPNQAPITGQLPVCVGFLTWNCSLPIVKSQLTLSRPLLPHVIWLFGCTSHSELATWCNSLKADFPEILIFYQAGSVQEVESILVGEKFRSGDQEVPRIDAIVVQGTADSGGHGLANGASLMTLLPEVVDFICKLRKTGVLVHSPVIPVLAAGGIIDSRGVAAALVLGAHGAVLGTRLIASEESEAHENFKKLVVDTGDGGQTTVRTRLFDDVRETAGDWPAVYGGRAFVNMTFGEWKSGQETLERVKELYNKAEEGDYQRLTAFVGTGVGLVRDVKPAKDIVEEVREGAKALLASFS